jgi:cystathionine beta-lyase
MERDKDTRKDGYFATRMVQAGRAGQRHYGFVNPPLLRGSTTLYETVAQMTAMNADRLPQRQTYGIMGSATHHALEDTVAAIEGGTRCQIFGSGLAALTTALLACLGGGDHCLMPDSVYAPTRRFCSGMLARLGVETEYYPPDHPPDEIARRFRPNTRVLFAESPGSHTFEVQDVPALGRVAHAAGALLLLDNTWGLHHFQPFGHGVDMSIQALTKYAGGHSDLLLGAVTTAADRPWKLIRDAFAVLGHYASPDDCWLALRGLRTLPVRLARQMQSGLTVARWLQARPEVLRVLHPALPGSPGHAVWKRDFSGAASLFGVVLQPRFSVQAMVAMIDSFALFGIGESWGGYESLIHPTDAAITRDAPHPALGGPTFRLHVGLEDPEDLIADLERGLAVLVAHA